MTVSLGERGCHPVQEVLGERRRLSSASPDQGHRWHRCPNRHHHHYYRVSGF